MDIVELRPGEDRRMTRLQGRCGKRARVAAALVTHPSVLMLDGAFNRHGTPGRQAANDGPACKKDGNEGRTIMFQARK